MKITHQDLPAVAADQSAQDSGSTPRTPASRIIGFTNNLLATSVVIVVALAVGNQLISLWGQPKVNNSSPAMIAAWPTIENSAIEFGNRPYSMNRQRIKGSQEEVIQTLSLSCQQILKSTPNPVGTTGDAEAKMIADAKLLTPIAEDPGKWRVFQVKNPQGNSFPMVIGLRDDCAPDTDSNTSRLVTWGIALAADGQDWTALVCRTSPSSPQNGTDELDLLIPTNSQQTLGITGANGGKLIGFTGGSTESAKRFYDQLAERQNWTLMDWKQTGGSWQTKLKPTTTDEFLEVQIQLSVDSNQNLRGLLVVEPNLQRTNPE